MLTHLITIGLIAIFFYLNEPHVTPVSVKRIFILKSKDSFRPKFKRKHQPANILAELEKTSTIFHQSLAYGCYSLQLIEFRIPKGFGIRV